MYRPRSLEHRIRRIGGGLLFWVYFGGCLLDIYQGDKDDMNIPFEQAMFFQPVSENAPRRPRVIVLHSMEAPEKPGTALSVARYFANGCPDAGGNLRIASAHYCIDPVQVVQSVQCKDVAYGAKGFNQLGIHVEHAGYARQSFSEWTSPDDLSELQLSAQLCFEVLMPKYKISAKWLTVTELRNAKSNIYVTGFTTHADITTAFKIEGGHTDPGPGFPKDLYMTFIRTKNGRAP